MARHGLAPTSRRDHPAVFTLGSFPTRNLWKITRGGTAATRSNCSSHHRRLTSQPSSPPEKSARASTSSCASDIDTSKLSIGGAPLCASSALIRRLGIHTVAGIPSSAGRQTSELAAPQSSPLYVLLILSSPSAKNRWTISTKYRQARLGIAGPEDLTGFAHGQPRSTDHAGPLGQVAMNHVEPTTFVIIDR